MAKIVISQQAIEESTSAANPFLSADGLVDVAAFAKLNTRIVAANKKVSEANTLKRLPKLATPILYTRKEIAKYSAALTKKNDHKYSLMRGQPVKSRTRMPAADSRVKMVVLLQGAYEGIDKTVMADVKKAVAAATQHSRKGEKVVGKVKVEKTKIRDAANKVFDKSVELLKAQLGGLKPTDIVESSGMMGKTVIVRLGPDNYVAVGKADKTRFAAAVKASKAAPVAAAAPAPARKVSVTKAPARKAAAPAKKAVRSPVRPK